MDLNKLFSIIDGLFGDVSIFRGLEFAFDNGIMVIDYTKDYQYPLEDGSFENVNGYVIDFVPFDESKEPQSYFALDEEGIREIVSSYILK